MILVASAEAVRLTCQVHSIRFEASASLGNFAERLTFALPAPGTRDTLCWHKSELPAKESDDPTPGAACADYDKPPDRLSGWKYGAEESEKALKQKP